MTMRLTFTSFCSAVILLGIPSINLPGAQAQLPAPPSHAIAPTTIEAEIERLKQANNFEDAIPVAEQALVVVEDGLGKHHPAVVSHLHNLADLYDLQGHFDQAEALYQRSLKVKEQHYGPNHPYVAITLNNLALLYSKHGQYAKAEPLFDRSLKIEQIAYDKAHPNLAITLNNLASLYEAQGQYDKAEAFYNRSLKLWQTLSPTATKEVAVGLNNLASVYEAQEQYTKAEPLYQRSLQIYQQLYGMQHPDVITGLNNLASLYAAQGNYEQAESLYHRSLKLQETLAGVDHPDVAISVNNLASVYFAQGKLKPAKRLYRRSLRIQEAIYGAEHPIVAVTLNNLARLYHLEGQRKKTLRTVQRSLAIEEINLNQNLVIGTEKDKQAYLATFNRSTDFALTLHLQAESPDPAAAKLALTTLLRRKGRILDTLGQRAHLLRQRLDPQLHAEFDQLVALRSQLARITFQADLTATERQDQIEVLNPQIQSLEASLSRQSATFHQVHQPVTLEAVQAAIPQQAALLEFIRYTPLRSHSDPSLGDTEPDRYAVYVLKSHGQPQWADLGPASEIDSHIQTFRRYLVTPRYSTQRLQPVAHTLESQLLAPIRSSLKDISHLLIAPDSQLNLIPYAALVDAQGHYLTENYVITYLTSGRDLIRVKDASVRSQRPLLVADPNFQGSDHQAQPSSETPPPASSFDLTFSALPGTATEAQKIEVLLPEIEVLSGLQATETSVKQSQNPQLLHLATHGFFLNPQHRHPKRLRRSMSQPIPNPLLRSGLAFAGINVRQSGQDDGILTALEISGLDFRGTELVVLSACETGLGEIEDGEGVYGLRRAFTLAGAHSQLMSLWKVSDQGTKDLMAAYYQDLQHGFGRSQALQNIQLAMLQGKLTGQDPFTNSPVSYQHPYFWSAFIPLGDWRPLSTREP